MWRNSRRGTASTSRAYPALGRVIPGRAVTPGAAATPKDNASIYPRADGDPTRSVTPKPQFGPIPVHAGGTHNLAYATNRVHPRAGGWTRDDLPVLAGRDPPIPARAGEPVSASADEMRARAYPRSGGGTMF